MIVTAPTSQSNAKVDTSSTTGEKPRADELHQSDFLTMLVAQLKNQDPMNPMENTEFTAQMAQFSSLEQLFNIKDTLDMLNTTTANANASQAFSLIGKEVSFEGSNIHIKNGAASDISFDVGGEASEVIIKVEDASGNVIRTINAGPRSSGEHSVSWDGKDANGAPIADGLYKYSVDAKDANGDPMTVTTFTRGVVEAVSFDNNVAYLHIGEAKFMMSEIKEVRDAVTSATTGTASTGATSGTTTVNDPLANQAA